MIHDNLIYSGPVRGYYYGIYLGGRTTVQFGYHSGQYWVLQPALYANETCGVAVPLALPAGVPISEVDGGNMWESCWSNFPQ